MTVSGTSRHTPPGFYTDLPPGKYTFRVIASNSDGVWNDNSAKLDFSVAPAYYQTNWFRALCAMFFLVLLWAAYQWRVRQLRHEFDMTLDARVNERTRIARELHDTLLQSAHGVLLRFQTVSQLLPERPMEAKDKLDSAIEQTADFITEARDEVQGLRDSTLQGNDLALAISTSEKARCRLNRPTTCISRSRRGRVTDCIPSFVTRPTRLPPKRCGTPFGMPGHVRSRLKSAMTLSNSDCACGMTERALMQRFSRLRARRDTTACPACGNAPQLWELS